MCEKVACLRQGLRVTASGSVRCRVTMVDPVLLTVERVDNLPPRTQEGREGLFSSSPTKGVSKNIARSGLQVAVELRWDTYEVRARGQLLSDGDTRYSIMHHASRLHLRYTQLDSGERHASVNCWYPTPPAPFLRRSWGGTRSFCD